MIDLADKYYRPIVEVTDYPLEPPPGPEPEPQPGETEAMAAMIMMMMMMATGSLIQEVRE